MPAPAARVERAPLDEEELAGALVAPGGLWSSLHVVESTGSTNADVRAAALAGAPEGLVLVAEEQTAGRGRLGRSWSAPPRSGLTFSVLLRPADVPALHWGWLPLLTGVAVATALQGHAGVDARLKWPNDVLLGEGTGEGTGEGKVAGVLVERVDDLDHLAPSAPGPAAVVGVGLNVTLTAEELPAPGATSLLLHQAGCTDRMVLLRALLHELAGRYADWRVAGGDATRSGLRAAYLDRFATRGRRVRVQQPGDPAPGVLTGTAVDVDLAGRLVVAPDVPAGDGGLVAVAAGDVVHVR